MCLSTRLPFHPSQNATPSLPSLYAPAPQLRTAHVTTTRHPAAHPTPNATCGPCPRPAMLSGRTERPSPDRFSLPSLCNLALGRLTIQLLSPPPYFEPCRLTVPLFPPSHLVFGRVAAEHRRVRDAGALLLVQPLSHPVTGHPQQRLNVRGGIACGRGTRMRTQ